MIPRLGGVTLSVLLHAGLIVLLLAWSAADWTRPLFVDLVERAESPGAPGRVAAPARSSRPAGRAAAPVPATSRAESRPAPVVPAPPVAPPLTPPAAPTPPPMERVVSTPPPAPVVPAEPALPPPPSAAVVPPPPATPSVPSAADGRRGGSEAGPGSVTRSGGPTREDAESGPGVAPPGGGSEGPPAEYGPYLRRFRQRVQESLIYPLAARQQGVGGTVELHVWLEATGRVRDVQVARSSSHRVLDDAAVETIRRLGPLPFPDSLPRRPLLIRLPLVYELR